VPESYLPVIFFAAIVISVPASLSVYLWIRHRNSVPAEAEVRPAEEKSDDHANERSGISIQFYFAATLFVAFDIAMVFLFAWAILLRGWLAAHSGVIAMASALMFLSILSIGYAWMLKKGALDWE
jgi:NADH-quinone oxidoreductase subunit A